MGLGRIQICKGDGVSLIDVDDSAEEADDRAVLGPASGPDNLTAAMGELGLTPPETPSPLNLFMNIPVIDGNAIDVLPPVSTPGSYVTLRAEMDCWVAFSACPQDMVPINGAAMTPTAAHFEIVG